MKKLIVFLMLAFVLLTSCDMRWKDADGFYMWNWQYHFDEHPESIAVQSHDGYMVDNYLYDEMLFTVPVTVTNVLERYIDVRITESDWSSYWVRFAPYESKTFFKSGAVVVE